MFHIAYLQSTAKETTLLFSFLSQLFGGAVFMCRLMSSILSDTLVGAFAYTDMKQDPPTISMTLTVSACAFLAPSHNEIQFSV